MTRGQRIGFVLIAATILVVGVIVNFALTGEDEGGKTEGPTTAAAPKPKAPPVLRAGLHQKIQVKKGEVAAFRVRSKTAEEVHVHGYDLKKDVPAGGTVSFRFPAKIEGVFEIELESSHTRLGELEVSP